MSIVGSEEEVVEKTVGMRKGWGVEWKREVGIAGTEKFNFFNKDNASKKLTFISESSKSSHASLLKEKDS